MPYSHFEHRHRFAVWAAARAAQRAFASVEQLRDAIESTDIADFVQEEAANEITEAQYFARHSHWCSQIEIHLREEYRLNATFGRAAKLVAVYLKSMIVVGGFNSTSLASVAHPPIDAVLLRNLSRIPDYPRELRARWRQARWTQLNEAEYTELLLSLRVANPEPAPWWKIEEHWTVVNE